MIDSNGIELSVGDDVAFYGGWHWLRRGNIIGFSPKQVRIRQVGHNGHVTVFPFHVLHLGKGEVPKEKEAEVFPVIKAIPE